MSDISAGTVSFHLNCGTDKCVLSVFLCSGSGKITSASDWIYNQNPAQYYTETESSQTAVLPLSALPDSVQKVVCAVTSKEIFAEFLYPSPVVLEVRADEWLMWELSEDHGTDSCLVCYELQRNGGQWKMKPQLQGNNSFTLKQLANTFGLPVETIPTLLPHNKPKNAAGQVSLQKRIPLDQLPNLRLGRQIGSGAAGDCYEAVQISLERLVAVKILKEENTDIERFEREIRILAQLDHPNIIKIHDRSAAGTLPLYYVMEYICGADGEPQTLADWIRENSGDGTAFRKIIRQAAEALQYAHERGVIHRDIKPANILITRSGDAKLGDFGISRDTKNATLTVTGANPFGTPGYIPPEVLEGQRADARSDIYSLGAAVYQLLTGKFPKGRYKNVSELNPQCGKEWDDLTNGMLESEPEDRFQSMSEVLTALEGLNGGVADLPSPSRQPPVPSGVPHSSFPNTAAGMSCAVIASVLSGFVADAERRIEDFRLAGNTVGTLQWNKHKKTLESVKAAFISGRQFPDVAVLHSIPDTDYSEVLYECYCRLADAGQAKVDELVLGGSIDEAEELHDFLAAKEITAAVAERQRRKEAAERRKREEAERIEKEQREAEARRKREEEESRRQAGDRLVVSMQGLPIAFRWCPAGTFTMGDKNISNVAPPHTVTLTRGFWLCETAVTQALWRAVMGRNPSDFVMGRNPSDFKGAKLPVENVSWDDSQEFVAQLNELNVAPSGFRFSLPTETQWEYGCRAGSTTAYCFGDNDNQLGGYAWYDDKWAGTHPVGTKQANAWGLYDMHGNVWEWCLDWYGDYPSSAVADTSGASSGSYRVFRGGSWRSSERNCRSAIRNGLVPGYRGSDLGVRVALVPQGE